MTIDARRRWPRVAGAAATFVVLGFALFVLALFQGLGWCGEDEYPPPAYECAHAPPPLWLIGGLPLVLGCILMCLRGPWTAPAGFALAAAGVTAATVVVFA